MITFKELKKKVRQEFPRAAWKGMDADYLSPKKDWVAGDLYFKNFYSWLWANNLDKWKEHWDCDNFAFAFYTFAQVCHARSMDKLKKADRAQGLAIGVMCYKMQTGGYHAINVVYTEGELCGFEPQNGKYVNLTQEERDSCYFVLF